MARANIRARTRTASKRASPAGRVVRRTRAASQSAGLTGIRIRMYRVGFGDCFLVSFDDVHVLIDCGVFKGTSGTGDLGSIEAAIANLAEETDHKLALIIMTHRHADHIAGFGRYPDAFRKFSVADVWMPIWETQYGDPRAAQFQAELTSIAADLQDHLDLRLAADETIDCELYHRVGNATGQDPLAATGKPRRGAGANAVALELLKTAFDVEPQYLKAGDAPKLPPALRALGLQARVLGPPPIEDIDMMKLMNLKRGVGQYLAMASTTAETGRDWRPFSPMWSVDPKQLSSCAFAEWLPRPGPGHAVADDAAVARARVRMEQVLASNDPDTVELAAKQLDAFLNNQSLVVLFTFRGKNLLFAGDAQGGNWEHWLYETDAPTHQASEPLARSARDILDGIDVYKVGHHGSTNATPIVVAETIRDGAVALCSTQRGVYGKSEDTAVPLPKLMEKLEQRLTLVRSDQIAIEVDGKTTKAEDHRELPKRIAGTLKPGPLWIDYLL